MSAKSTNTFAKVRADHARETAEDYVEAIADIVHQHGECRVRDLADVMGVSHVTVTRIVNRLQDDDLITTEPYRPIYLTEQGEKLATESRRRHSIVLQFLRAIGVPAQDAQHDAEGIEHHVGQKTLRCMERFVKSRISAKENE